MNLYESLDLKELILKCRERDDVAFSELVRRYKPMINKLISAFSLDSFSFDEAFSEACVALHKAALSYDFMKNEVTFGLYARICIKRRLYDIFSKNRESFIAEDVEIESLSSAVNVESMLLFREKVQRYISTAREILSDYEYRIFMLYIQGYDTAAMCKELSRDKKSVENAKARMLKNLRAESGRFSDL